MHGPNPSIASLDGVFAAFVMMEDKIHILDGTCCLTYEPRRPRKWESWLTESAVRSFWVVSCCVALILCVFLVIRLLCMIQGM